MSQQTETHYATRDTDIAIVEEWLLNKGTTTWWNWDLTDKAERAEAAEHFYMQIESLVNYLDLCDARNQPAGVSKNEGGFDVV